MERKPESQRTREQLKALMAGRREVEDRRSVWLAARPTIEEAWEEAARTPWPKITARRGAGYRPARSDRVPHSRRSLVGPSLRLAPAKIVRARTEALKALAVEICLDDTIEACIAHLRFPLGHCRAIRTTNLIARLLGEERRRAGSAGAATLMAASLTTAARGASVRT